MSAGCQVNVLENCFKSAINLVLVSVDRSAPTHIAYSGRSGWLTCFSMQQSSFDFLWAKISYGAAIIWWKTCRRGVLATIVVESVRVLNLTVPWIVDSMAWNLKSVGRLSNILCPVGKQITENSIIRVMLSFPSWLTNVKGGVWYTMDIGCVLWNRPKGRLLVVSSPPSWNSRAVGSNVRIGCRCYFLLPM